MGRSSSGHRIDYISWLRVIGSRVRSHIIATPILWVGRSESHRKPQDGRGQRSDHLNVTYQYTPLLNCASLKPGSTCNTHLSTYITCLEKRVCNVLQFTNVLPLTRTTTCSCCEPEIAINHIWSPGVVCRSTLPQLVRPISGNLQLGRSKEKCTKCYKKVLHRRMHSSATCVNIKGLIYFSAIKVF